LSSAAFLASYYVPGLSRAPTSRLFSTITKQPDRDAWNMTPEHDQREKRAGFHENGRDV
jgi:hypothetical protein